MEVETTASERAHARAALYYYLSALFVYPDATAWRMLQEFSGEDWQRVLAILCWSAKRQARLQDRLHAMTKEQFLAEHLAIFGHTAAGELRPYEAGYGTNHVFQETHCLADVAGFYRAFGLEPCEAKRERPDHIAVELEFMHVLALKEAYALAHDWDEKAEVCREAQAGFLRDHLGRWAPSFLKSLAERTRGGIFEMIAHATAFCVEAHCHDAGIEAGVSDLKPEAMSEPEGINFPCMAADMAGASETAGIILKEETE